MYLHIWNDSIVFYTPIFSLKYTAIYILLISFHQRVVAMESCNLFPLTDSIRVFETLESSQTCFQQLVAVMVAVGLVMLKDERQQEMEQRVIVMVEGAGKTE